jgi:hypothetical protein
VRQLRIGALRHVAIAGDERRGIRVVERRVGAQELLEVVVASLEADLRDDRVHPGADAPHLRQADLVNLLRRLRRRRMPAHVVGVHLGTLRERIGGDRAAARGQVGLDQKLVEAREGRAHGLRVCSDRRLGQAIAIGRRDGRRPSFERAQQRTRPRIGDDLRRDLPGNVAKRDLRRGQPLRQPLLHQRDGLIDDRRRGEEARDEVLVVRHARGRHEADDAGDVLLDAFHLIDRHVQVVGNDAAQRHGVVAELQPLHRGRDHVAVEVVIELVARRKPGALDPVQLPDRATEMVIPRGDRFRRIVGPPRVVPWIAERGRRLRVLAHPELPVVVEERAEALSRGRTGLRNRGGRQRDERDRQEEGQVKSHVRILREWGRSRAGVGCILVLPAPGQPK